jgi:hypothetical protein
MTAGAARLAIFTVLKPLVDRHVETIQRNAIRSWLALRPRPEIVLFGDDTTAGLAASLDVRHVTDFTYSEHGAPLLNSVFPRAEELTASPFLAYVNADIILLGGIAVAVERVARARARFLLVGSRWDLDLGEPLAFEPDWERHLRALVDRDGCRHPPAGSDYFVFPRGFWGELPPLALGRSSFDNWLIYRARQTGDAVIDGSRAVLVVHQNHDYSHIGGEVATRSGPDAKRNYELAGGAPAIYLLGDASHVLTRFGLLPSVLSPRHLGQRARRLIERHDRLLTLSNRWGALRDLRRRRARAERA